jgi:hypothetical protein
MPAALRTFHTVDAAIEWPSAAPLALDVESAWGAHNPVLGISGLMPHVTYGKSA